MAFDIKCSLSIYLVFLTLSICDVTGQWWSRPSRSEIEKLEKDIKATQSDISDLKAKGDERHQNIQKDIRILQLRLDAIPSVTESSLAPYGLVSLAVQDGVQYLLKTRRNGQGWGSRQNAEAVIALRLADPERFSVGKTPINYDFIQGVNDMLIELKSELNRPNFENNTVWARGKLAEYMVGLTSACEDTQSFYGFDVARIVRQQFNTFKSFFKNQKFALSWLVLALCNANLTEETGVLDILSENPGDYKFEIDEASMIVIALSCVNNPSYSAVQRAAEDFILNGTKPDGSFGNEYTTGLAVQALTRYSGPRNDVDGIIQKAQDWLARIVVGNFDNVEQANQVLPALTSRSYADIKDLVCHRKPDVLVTTTPSVRQTIQVLITVRDNVISQSEYEVSWLVNGKRNDSMYVIMQKLEQQEPSFNFSVSISNSFGALIQSIVGITPRTNLNQYWQFLRYPDVVMQKVCASSSLLADNNCALPIQNAALEQRLRCSRQEGTKWLLNARNAEWGWGSRGEALSIIALHLSDGHLLNKSDPNVYISVKEMDIDLLKALSHDPDLSSIEWGHGVLGIYVTALIATCQDPHNFYGFDLVDKLHAHVENFTEYYKSNKFAYSWALIGICLADGQINDRYKDHLVTQFGKPSFDIDTASMILMALSCEGSGGKYDSYIQNLASSISSKQLHDGSFGNEYTTGPAIQALISSNNSQMSPSVDRALLSMTNTLEQSSYVFRDVLAAAQVLPALSRTSFIGVFCANNSVSTLTTPRPSGTVVTVQITVESDVDSVGLYSRTWNTTNRSGQNLFQILEKLDREDTYFSFQYQRSTFGVMIDTVNGFHADPNKHMFWSVLEYPDKALSIGISHVIPHNGDHYTLRLTTW